MSHDDVTGTPQWLAVQTYVQDGMFLPTDEWNTPKLAFWRPDDRWPE